MKILHCSNLHLDSKMSSNIGISNEKMRKNEVLNTFLKMINYAKENEVKVVVITGDLFDNLRTTTYTKKLVHSTIRDNKDIDFYYIIGKLSKDGLSDYFEEMPKNLKFFKDNWTKYEYDLGAGRNLVIAGVDSPKCGMEELPKKLELDEKNYNFVTLYADISKAGATAKLPKINIENYNNLSIDYLGLGGLLNSQKGSLQPLGKYYYPGSIEGRGFNECGEHGFVIIDINESTLVDTIEFIPFAERTYHKIEIDCTSFKKTEQLKEKVLELVEGKYKSSDLLLIELIGKVTISSERNTDTIKNLLLEKFFYATVEDHTQLDIKYEDYSLDTSLRGELVRLVQGEEQLSEEQKKEIIKCAIYALNSDMI